MKTTLQVLAIVASIVAASNAVTPITKCKGDVAPPVDDVRVEINGCTKAPCVLKRGGKYNLEIRFKSLSDAEKLQSVNVGTVKGKENGKGYTVAPLPWAIDVEACSSVTKAQDNSPACPLKRGQWYTYNNMLEISKRERQATFNEEWHLSNENDEIVACFQVLIKLE